MRIDVLNPEGRDAPVDYRDGVGRPDPQVHPPVNYWAYAAATGGRFHQTVDTIIEPCDAIVVLLRQRSRAALKAIRALKAAGRRVFVSWKETGIHQIEQQLGWWWQRADVTRALRLADGAVASTEASVTYYRRFAPAGFPVHCIPTPYPVDLPDWDFSIPLQQRRGILIGTREFDVPSRRHAEALRLAAELAGKTRTPLTVMNPDGARGRAQIERLLPTAELRLVEQRLAYPDYLRMMATHRIVLQRDASAVPGQVAGDALLCRIVTVGGNGSSERVAFPDYATLNEDPAGLLDTALRLLTDDAAYGEAVARSQQLAAEKLSYAWARQALSVLTTRR